MRAARLLLALAGLAILAWLAWTSRADLQRVFATARGDWMLAAVMLGIAFAASHALLFARVLEKYQPGPRRDSAIAYLLSQPGKYVPGKVWSAVMQSFALQRPRGLGGIAAANVEMAGIAMTQLATLGVACWLRDAPWLAGLVFVAGTVATIAIAIAPSAAWMARLAPRMAARLSVQATPPSRAPAHRGTVGAIALASMALNLAASASVVLAAGSSVAASDVPDVMASLYLAFAAAMLALPVPAGIGVREAAAVGIANVIAPGVPAALIVSVALLARAWQLAVDAACFVIGALAMPARS